MPFALYLPPPLYSGLPEDGELGDRRVLGNERVVAELEVVQPRQQPLVSSQLLANLGTPHMARAANAADAANAANAAESNQ